MNNTAPHRAESTMSIPILRRLRALLLPLAVAALVVGCDNSSSKSSTGTNAASAAATRPAPFVMPGNSLPAGPADEAWQAIQTAIKTPPQPPEAWATKKPTQEDVGAFRRGRGELAVKIADQTKDFYTRYAADPRAEEARVQEMRLLDAAVALGLTNALTRLEGLEKARLADPKLPEEDRISIRLTAATRAAEILAATDEPKARAGLEDAARKLITEFPQHTEPYQVLLSLAGEDTSEKARTILQSLISTNVPEEIRETAQQMLKRAEVFGKPLDLRFTSVEGKEVDLATYKGKVVLIDFWATWCKPCIRALPMVKEAYSRLQPKGFEILGISFDDEKETLNAFTKRENMTWPQYFDGNGWDNVIGSRFGIGSIPAMWLVDRKGVLRDLNADDDLVEKVTSLLSEPAP